MRLQGPIHAYAVTGARQEIGESLGPARRERGCAGKCSSIVPPKRERPGSDHEDAQQNPNERWQAPFVQSFASDSDLLACPYQIRNWSTSSMPLTRWPYQTWSNAWVGPRK